MSIYEVIGGFAVVFFACVGVYTIGHLTYLGLKHVTSFFIWKVEPKGFDVDAAFKDWVAREEKGDGGTLGRS